MATDSLPANGLNVLGIELNRSDARDRYREKIARITLDSMVQFVGLLDARGTVLEINKVALDAVGISLSEVEGQPFWETFWWQVSEPVNTALREYIVRASKGEFVRWDTPIFGRAGGTETIIIDASFMPVKDEKGDVVLIVAEGRDITEKKAYEREIARQREELAQLDKLKTQFFANISHEFRTPLSLMMAPVEDALAPETDHLPADRIDATRIQASTAARPDAFVQELLRRLPGDSDGIAMPSNGDHATPPSNRAVAATPDAQMDDQLSGSRVLVVDDNSDMREYIRRLLAGYDVHTVANGAAALQVAREQRPDLVLSDIMMPGRDGFELMRELRADPNLSYVPVILLSARAGEEARIEGLEAGADEYLVKPFSARELLASVRAHLRLAESRRQSRETVRASEERHRAMVTATSDVVYQMSGDWKVMQPLDGRNLVASSSTPIAGWMHKNIPEFEHVRVQAAIDEAIVNTQTFEMEHRVVRADGSLGWTHSRAVPITNDSGNIIEWFGTASDITRRKQAEEDLKDIRSRMEAALEAGAIGTWAWDVPGDRFFGDSSLAHIFGVPHETVAGGPLAGVVNAIHPDDRDRVARLVQNAIDSEDRYEADYRVTRPDGTIRWVTARGQVERDALGNALRFPGVVIDVTERKFAEAALDRVTAASDRFRRLYETVISATPDFIYVFSLDHRVLFANDSLIEMWGRGRDGAIGRTFLEIGYEPWHAEMHGREIDQVRATKLPIRGEVPFNGTFGRRIYDYIFVPVIGGDGEVEAVAGTTRDVTDRKEAELALAESDRKKDEFIALLAHELRNPLAPIRNGLEVLRQAQDTSVRERAQIMMDRQLSHMVRLIDDLLDVSRIGQKKMELRRSRVTLADVVENAVEAAQPSIDAAGHELFVSLPTRAVYLDADVTRLAQVLSNLLTNSAKYTERGGKIWLSAERANDTIEIAVKDNGIGIPKESLEGIFDMFSQVDRSIERSTGGLGIGLALVQGLTVMHGGTVVAQSDGEGKGSTFVVTLPTVAGSDDVSREPYQPALNTTPSRRVLVVDDNRDGAESLGMMLELAGHEVVLAHDGVEAVERAEQFRPDVILMDVGMPRLNGLDATRQIRQQPWGKDATIIALTGWGQAFDREHSRDAGCNGHLIKPVALEELSSVLEASTRSV